MFDHVTIRVSDLPASDRFYRLVLATLGFEDPTGVAHYLRWNDLSIHQASEDRPATRGLHIGLRAESPEAVNDFWEAGTAAGYRSDGEPGPRPAYGPDYYGGFLLDPDGNSIEASLHDNQRAAGSIDHLWMRVADLGASRRFYEAIAPHAGFIEVAATAELARFRGLQGGGSLTVVRGDPPTGHVHIAFPAIEDGTVDAFHAAATAAGHPDNGAPGERAEYHPGYYGAFVLDPDGNNIEVVHHGVTARQPGD